MLRVTLQLTGIPPQGGGKNTSIPFNATETVGGMVVMARCRLYRVQKSIQFHTQMPSEVKPVLKFITIREINSASI